MKIYEVTLYDKESPAYATCIKKGVRHIRYIYWLGKWIEFDWGDRKERYNAKRYYIGKILEYDNELLL